MPSWNLRDSTRPPNRIYERPLGLTELGFYWDGVFNGTADSIQRAVVEVGGDREHHLFSEANVSRTWVTLKQQFPLLGSKLEELGDKGEMVQFVVAEERLRTYDPQELDFRSISSLEADQNVINDILNGERLLSNNHLARISILTPTDQTNRFVVLIHVAHCITDGIANSTILRSFLDVLSHPDGRIGKIMSDLEGRLALAIASEDLVRGPHQSLVKQRWYRAIGHVVSSIQMSKMTGGHTLPRTFTPATYYTPAQSCAAVSSFPAEASACILGNCRKSRITFGNAYPVLAQVALTRILCRRYIRGNISNDEWEFRKREPMHTAGPMNLRPLLDRDWYDKGGAANVSVSIGFFFYTLPFMPLGLASRLAVGSGLPSFRALLSPERFLLRCNMMKDQAARVIKHPLFFDIATARLLGRVERIKGVAMKWREGLEKPGTVGKHNIPVAEQGLYGPVVGHGGSSFGNLDALIPRDYPQPSADNSSLQGHSLYIQSSSTHLHCRPGELYLGAATSRQQLHLHIFWDGNVFDKSIVYEWLGEVRNAAQYYLGQGVVREQQTKL